MSMYAVAISFKFENDEEQIVMLDSIEDTSSTTSSTVTRHPIPSGEYVADHMYKNPVTYSISGSVSMNGTYLISKSEMKLANFQSLFERIKNEAVLCNIMKIKISNQNVPLFLQRKDMVLRSISWTEKINTLDFDMTFEQALIVTAQEYDVDISDTFLPNVTEPKTLSFTDTFIDWNVIDRAFIEDLIAYDLIEANQLNRLSGLGVSGLVSVGISLLVAKVVFSFVTLTVASGGLFALIAGAAVLIISAINLIIARIEEHKYKIKQFELFEDDRQNRLNNREVERFSNFVSQIHQDFEQLNDVIKVYQISSNDDQEVMLSIDGEYYIFKFTTQNTNGKRTLKIYDQEEREVKVMNDISGALRSYADCTSQNYLIKTEATQQLVYLMNLSEDDNDLSTYCILTTAQKPEAFVDFMYNTFKNALIW